jgi:hypothetical protein
VCKPINPVVNPISRLIIVATYARQYETRENICACQCTVRMSVHCTDVTCHCVSNQADVTNESTDYKQTLRNLSCRNVSDDGKHKWCYMTNFSNFHTAVFDLYGRRSSYSSVIFITAPYRIILLWAESFLWFLLHLAACSQHHRLLGRMERWLINYELEGIRLWNEVMDFNSICLEGLYETAD